MMLGFDDTVFEKCSVKNTILFLLITKISLINSSYVIGTVYCEGSLEGKTTEEETNASKGDFNHPDISWEDHTARQA